MHVVVKLFAALHDSGGDADALKLPHDLVGGEFLGPLSDDFVQSILILESGVQRIEPGV